MALGGPSNLHLDILRNRDCTIEWEDVFTGMSSYTQLHPTPPPPLPPSSPTHIP